MFAENIYMKRGLGSGKWGRAHKKMIDLDIIPTFRVWRDPASCGCGDAVTWSARSQEPRVAACRHLPCVCGEIVRAVISVGDVHFFRQERDQVGWDWDCQLSPIIAELSFYKYILNSPATQVLHGWNPPILDTLLASIEKPRKSVSCYSILQM